MAAFRRPLFFGAGLRRFSSGDAPPARLILKPKTVFITGVSTGIGRALASAAIATGFRVYGTVRRDSDARNLKAEMGDLFHPVVLEITDDTIVQRVAAELLEELGPGGIDVLVNNAGIAVPGGLTEIDGVSLRSQIDVNTIAPVLLTQALLPLLEKMPRGADSRQGLIVNISSMVLAIHPPLSGAYTASKAALEAFSHAWRRELACRGIKVMIVRPGAVKSDIWGKGEAGPPVPDPLYAKAHRRKAELSARGLKGAYDCREFADKIVKLMDRRRPPPLVTLSREPWYARTLPSILPRRWADLIINSVVGLKNS